MRAARALAAAWLAGAAAPAIAQPAIVSPGAERVSVSIYRDAERDVADGIDADDPTGFALVTERRTVDLPAGASVIRFEGVAGNILPESAIVADLPAEVREKNLDADLISPRTLYDRALGRRVILRRTDPATGRVREEQATIRSSAAGAAVLSLAGGNEALRCSGLPETIVHAGLPDGLSARPTLSVAITTPRAMRVTLTLSYLAGGFDWQADYVLALAPDGSRADLSGWVTLASSDVTAFPGAEAQVIAGAPEREERQPRFSVAAGRLTLRCWPVGAPPPPPPPPPPAPPPPVMMARAAVAEDIIVTGQRIAPPEDVGDLKLYRIPHPTDIAARGQKQVAFLDRRGVPVTIVYETEVAGSAAATRPVVRAENRVAAGLGQPLPAGKVVVLRDGARPILLGEPAIGDRAVGERLRLELDPTPAVSAQLETLARKRGGQRQRLTIRNANPAPITHEARFVGAITGVRLPRVDGAYVWRTRVPANGVATLTFTRPASSTGD